MDPPCRFCSILAETLPWTKSRRIDLMDLESGWKRGCKGCTFLYHIIPSLVGPAFREVFPALFFEPRDAADTGPLRIVVYFDRVSSREPFEKLRLQVYREPGSSASPWQAVGIANHVGPDALSQPVIQLAKSWIEDCQNRVGRHVSCKPPSKTVLPSRLVDVGSSAADGCRLYLASENETGVYIALSHCWGGTAPTQTTQSNLGSFTRELPEPLPQTFSDAVAVTRALGVRYLWIDSLCIIQDSPEDWALHAPRMAKVYGDALVTISADAAANSSEGFLQQEDRDRSRAHRVPYGEGHGDPPIWVRARGTLGYQLPFHGWPHKVQDSRAWESSRFCTSVQSRRGGATPKQVAKLLADFCLSRNAMMESMSKLSTRGWVFQERALAPRTLHFGPAEVGWECRSLISCECSASSMRYRRTTGLLKRAVTEMPWHAVIAEYTRLNLTVWEDRLVALAGLAEARHEQEGISDNQYAAGMWVQDIRTQLLWMSVFRRPALRSYVAPSWSWASISGSVNGPDPAYLPLLGDWSVVNVHCPPADVTASAFGNCQTGSFIEINGPVISVALDWYNNGWSAYPVRPAGNSLRWPWITAHWDCDARKARALDEQHTGSFLFLLVSAKNQRAEGLLLKELESSPGLSNDMAEVRSYERIGYLQEAPLFHRRTWSDESSDSEVDEDSRPSEPPDKWQEFAHVRRIRVY